MYSTKKNLLLILACIFISFSTVFACGEGGEGGTGGDNDGNVVEIQQKISEGIKNGTVVFIPKLGLKAREEVKAGVRKIQDKNEKKAGLMIKAGNLMNTGENVATGVVIGSGLALGAVALPGAALAGSVAIADGAVTVATVEGGAALTELGATTVGVGYSAATGYASGGSATKSGLQSAAIEVMFPKAHAFTKAAIDYVASNAGDTKNISSSASSKNINVYNSSAYANSKPTHSSSSYGSMHSWGYGGI